jgi:hypothetical protein
MIPLHKFKEVILDMKGTHDNVLEKITYLWPNT